MVLSEPRALGKTGLSVHPFCLGGSVLGWEVSKHESFDVLDAFLDAGGNFIDTADSYSKWARGHVGGESESVLGEWLARRGCRDRVVLASKVGGGSDGLEAGLGRTQIVRGCEASLRRLGVDHLDLYYGHYDDPDTPLEETLGAFDELVRAGKVRAIGASNYTAARIQQALEVSRREGLAAFQVFSPRLNLLERTTYGPAEQEMAGQAGLGVATWAALASGFLSGRYSAQHQPADPTRARIQATYYDDPRALAVLEATTDVAARLGVTVPQVATAWVLAQPFVTCAITSVKNRDQLAELFGTANCTLGTEELGVLDAAYASVPSGRTHKPQGRPRALGSTNHRQAISTQPGPSGNHKESR